MKMFSKIAFVLAMTLSVSSFAKVRIKLVDKDDKPIVGAPVILAFNRPTVLMVERALPSRVASAWIQIS